MPDMPQPTEEVRVENNSCHKKSCLCSALAGAVGGGVVVLGYLLSSHLISGKSGEPVRDYLMEHPEVIPQAMEALQQRETDKLVSQNRTALETPFAGVWDGAEKGRVTIVEFSDYACGFCRKANGDLNRLLSEDKDIRLVIRQLPILGPDSEIAARTALAIAKNSSKFSEFHHQIYNSKHLSPEVIVDIVKSLGLNPQDIAKQGSDPAITQEITKNILLARELGLTGTPAFIIGDKVFSGVAGYDALKEAVAKIREKSSK
ncbi:DsbA family protein [Zymomonas mobilis]|uniref:DsbA family protein n=1 Tax=Zymomonas mobilis TaxID=542 RepID=UPI0039EBFE48